jgi:transcriptional regulator with XRE-family HTH domain
LTQEKLADLAHVDRSYISLIERGIRNPTTDVLYKLAKPLHTTPAEILSAIDNVLRHAPEYKWLGKG